ncbi:MAG: DEAD/DEAH box helicase [Planctomycetes bacterium]|nr:DEAD/DEAH box helicase [Planctomycetota bacterium]
MHSSDRAVERFHDLQLDPKTLASLEEVGYQTPTPIQAAFIPVAMSGRDCIGQAQTGTGKTAAYVLPILQHLSPRAVQPQALVLAPTRELAVQIEGEAKRLANGHGVRIVSLCGGHPMRRQINELMRGCHFVVGTPGRVIHHIQEGILKLGQVRHVVLDEADRMLDIGFRPAIERILRGLPRDRQTMLLSATLADPVRRLAQRYMKDPVVVDVSPEQLIVQSIRQSYFTVDLDRKFDLLLRLIERDQPTRAIIFCRRKRDAEYLSHDLAHRHLHVARMHGDLDQNKRNRIMDTFRSGRIRFLVSTDLVGRGIDVDDISHIINYDIPDDPENYVHRIGRTARMGKDGIAYTFVTPDQGNELTAIEMFINHQIECDRIEGFEAFRKRSHAGSSSRSRNGSGRRPSHVAAAR